MKTLLAVFSVLFCLATQGAVEAPAGFLPPAGFMPPAGAAGFGAIMVGPAVASPPLSPIGPAVVAPPLAPFGPAVVAPPLAPFGPIVMKRPPLPPDFPCPGPINDVIPEASSTFEDFDRVVDNESTLHHVFLRADVNLYDLGDHAIQFEVDCTNECQITSDIGDYEVRDQRDRAGLVHLLESLPTLEGQDPMIANVRMCPIE